MTYIKSKTVPQAFEIYSGFVLSLALLEVDDEKKEIINKSIDFLESPDTFKIHDLNLEREPIVCVTMKRQHVSLFYNPVIFLYNDILWHPDFALYSGHFRHAWELCEELFFSPKICFDAKTREPPLRSLFGPRINGIKAIEKVAFPIVLLVRSKRRKIKMIAENVVSVPLRFTIRKINHEIFEVEDAYLQQNVKKIVEFIDKIDFDFCGFSKIFGFL